MQIDIERQTPVTDEQRESYEWLLLTRKLRCIGLTEAAARLEAALDTSRLQNVHGSH